MESPLENKENDIKDALQHAYLFVGNFEGVLEDLTPDMFSETFIPNMHISEIENYDDTGSWGEWDYEDLADLPSDELFDELLRFRGQKWAYRAMGWLFNEVFPAIIIIDSPLYTGIGDGRGRVSLAIGMGIKTLPVILLERKKE